MSEDFTIRVVIFQEEGWLVAQCLDVDIAVQAKTDQDLQDELNRVLVGRILASRELGVSPFGNLPPAPRRYWEMFSHAQSTPRTMLPTIPVDISCSLPALELKVAA